jgi:hypothetical protein
MQKPILRWTIGQVSTEGMECLKISVHNIVKLYKDQFQLFICYNNIEKNELNWTKKYPIELLCQHDYVSDLKIKPIPQNPCWKLYPARIDLDLHEMFIDNDLLIYEKIPTIDNFLKSNNLLFMTQAIKRSYGAFDSLIKSPINLNTGFFGVYPKFDLKNEINKTIEKNNLQWKNHLDEQGLLAYIWINKKFELITLDQIYVCHKDFPYKLGKYGQHFVQLNKKMLNHWETFLSNQKK